jgi:hypothetical protein
MKRDMDIARKILFRIESIDESYGDVELDIDGTSSEVVDYHVLLLWEAGYLKGKTIQKGSMTDPIVIPFRLTWGGHDFLDDSRDDERWFKAKGIFARVGGVTFDVAKAVLTKIATDQAMALL